jgi:hypothetical protein
LAKEERRKLDPFGEVYLKGLHGDTDDSVIRDMLFEVKQEIQSASYAIGWHMAYTIRMMLPQIRSRNFLSMSQYQFVKLYEQACAKANIRPVVSLNSGKGYFDYNRTIRQLYEIFSKKSKTGKRFFHKCKLCNARIPYDHNYCGKHIVLCPLCKVKIKSDAKFCPSCGFEFKRPI